MAKAKTTKSTRKSKRGASKTARASRAAKREKTKTTKRVTTKKSEKRDQKARVLDVEDDLQALFSHVSKELLLELLECNNRKIPRTTKKTAVVEQVLALCTKRGQKLLVEDIGKENLNDAIKELKGSDAESPNNKIELQKEFNELTAKAGGLEEAVKKFSSALIDQICKALSFQEQGAQKEKARGLFVECQSRGARTLFDRTKMTYLRELCDHVKLATVGAREHLVNRFLGQACTWMLDNAEAPPRKKREKKDDQAPKEKAPRAKKEKQPSPPLEDIKKGVTSEDLHQYYGDDLKKYCDQKRLKKGTSKKEMIKIILAFLDGDVENTKKGVKRKRKSSKNSRAKKAKTASA